jgi:hypothetical protein
MEAGTEAGIRRMSPLRVAEAIAALGSGGSAWDGDIADINLDGGTDIGADLADADLILVDDGGAGTNRKCAMSRVKTYIGAVNTANTPTANEFARFTDADTIEGRTYAEARADLDLEVGVDLARWLQRVTNSGDALVGSNLTATVNAHHVLTISGMTAARSFVIPAGTAEGDLISWECITAAPATAGYEMVLIGDTGVTLTLGGTDRTAAADEAYRYFQVGESGILRWDATASKWRLAKNNDGRIPQSARIALASDITTSTGGAWNPADLDTISYAIGVLTSVTGAGTSTITVRRAGTYLLSAGIAGKSGGTATDNELRGLCITSGGNVGTGTVIAYMVAYNPSIYPGAVQTINSELVSANSALQLNYYWTTANTGLRGLVYITFMMVAEVVK